MRLNSAHHGTAEQHSAECNTNHSEHITDSHILRFFLPCVFQCPCAIFVASSPIAESVRAEQERCMNSAGQAGLVWPLTHIEEYTAVRSADAAVAARTCGRAAPGGGKCGKERRADADTEPAVTGEVLDENTTAAQYEVQDHILHIAVVAQRHWKNFRNTPSSRRRATLHLKP